MSIGTAFIIAAQISAALDIHVVDQHGVPVEHAVVTAGGSSEVRNGNDQTSVIEQRQQQFAPRVTVISRNAKIRFPNRDITQHHVYSFSPVKSFEIELYRGDSPAPIRFEHSGIVSIGCNIHDWMLGYIMVTDDNLFGITGSDGIVHFEEAANSLGVITIWHPAMTSGKPAEFPAIVTGETSGSERRIAVELNDVDPLDYETDPLQDLFRGKVQ